MAFRSKNHPFCVVFLLYLSLFESPALNHSVFYLDYICNKYQGINSIIQQRVYILSDEVNYLISFLNMLNVWIDGFFWWMVSQMNQDEDLINIPSTMSQTCNNRSFTEFSFCEIRKTNNKMTAMVGQIQQQAIPFL